MTRKDFQLIAATIAALEFKSSTPDDVLRHRVAVDFSQALAETNPNFDAERFVAACAPKAGPASLKRLRQLHREATNGEG